MTYNDFLKQVLKRYNINLETDKILNINGVIIPNYSLIKLSNILDRYWTFEFEHQISKIYFLYNDYFTPRLTCYETIESQISQNDIIFDCGGNMGIFAAAAATKGQQVYSFEPMSLIRKNLRYTQSFYNNITIIPKGLSNQTEIVKFIQKDNPGASREPQYDNNNKNEKLYYEFCELITIDDFVSSTNIIPTFIKSDTEGGEIKLLEGAQNTIQKYHPKLAIAFHASSIQNMNYVKSLLKNYKLNLQINNDLLPAKEAIIIGV